jgi:fibronectin type 3 domain-containing protein
MKKFSIILVATLLGFATQAQSIKSKAYKTGNYIFCGAELPKNFSYVIERKATGEAEFTTVANLKAPSNQADCQARLMSLPNSIAAFTKVDNAQLAKFWQLANRNETLDSLYAFALDPRYQYVAGCAWFDEGIKEGNYQYRISRSNKAEDSLNNARDENIAFPSNSYKGMAAVVRFKPQEKDVLIHYAISDTITTAGIKILRSQHQENNYAEVPTSVLFTKVNNQIVAQITDATAVKGITYSYVAIPYDALGNLGIPSDTLSIYNMVNAGDIGMIQTFTVKPIDDKRGMQITWKLNTQASLTSLDIYRGSTYDGKYFKVASVSPKETTYFDDNNLKPATAYYYYLVANAAYGKSFPSARTPAILKGDKPNLIPPQNITIARSGNIVSLNFVKVEQDTRGYYVYRANGYTGALEQLPRMLLSTDSIVTYIDTLPSSNTAKTYSYAVADINTSYNISPQSDRVSVQTSGTLPIPTGVAAQLSNKKVFVSWRDASKNNAAVSSYKLYRSSIDADGKEIQAAMPIATIDAEQNSFVDSTIQDGARYRYQVQAIGLTQNDVSTLSQWASIGIADNAPLQPGEIIAFAADKKAVLKWSLPAGVALKSTKIYRSLAGANPELIKEVTAPTKTFEDTNIVAGKTYYYVLVTVGKNNTESQPTDAVAVKLKN